MNGPRPNGRPASLMGRALTAMSVVTMVMTMPQVWVVWFDRQTAGVSLLSWAAYLASALLWFVHGVQMRDRNIYVACIGWIALDGAIVAGVLWYR